jgi:hypothetical protein
VGYHNGDGEQADFSLRGGVCLAFHCRRGSWSVLGHLNLRKMMRQTTGSYHPKGSSGPGACKNVFLGENFQVQSEMRDEILVYNPFLSN